MKQILIFFLIIEYDPLHNQSQIHTSLHVNFNLYNIYTHIILIVISDNLQENIKKEK
jgi:hypothetical protein